MFRSLLAAVLLLCAVPSASAQQVRFTSATGDAALARTMPVLAERTLAVYREDDRDRYLANLFRLQLVAGRYPEAAATIRNLRELRAANGLGATGLYVQYEVYAQAKALQRAKSISFARAFEQAFRTVHAGLNDNAALQAQFSFRANLDAMQDDLRKALRQQRGKSSIALTDALELLRRYQVRQAYAAMAPLAGTLIAEDDARRYVADADVLVRTPDGANIAALMVRPKSASKPLPTLLQFTIYANDDWSLADAKRAAAHGYVGVVAYTRGKGRSPDAVVPYEHDGDDARAVIDWISQQPWSDGRVGMYGGSYNSFAQWAAAKRLPRALKALMTSASAAPGIDIPMQGNIFMSFLYPWPFYVGNNHALDDATYGDQKRWDALNRNWYRSGQAYRDLDRIDGTANPIFHRWLEHPGYDAYWQAMIPYQREFAAIDIPVLATSGYFDGALVGVQYYFNEHTRYNRRADHTLVIGPYEHFTMQTGVGRVVQGYEVDPVANVDLQDLRFQWFDYVFKGTAKPELLKDRVNYQVMGANVWKHAPSLAAMSNGALRMYLLAGEGKQNRLSTERPGHNSVIEQRIDFTDRGDGDWTAPLLSVTPTLDDHNGLVFTSAPMEQSTEVSGLLSGRLDFVANKRDLDVSVALYERMADGRYLQLTTYMGRVSYARDRNHRRLLTPGKRQRVDFVSERATSRLLQPGSALVAVLSINKQPDLQINYGSGKDVSDETVADAGEPLQVQWRGGSYLDIPVRR
ncbi:CocE/NonD family hydrolase [Lysobacter tyrosinilyticus]